jgi:hypothetical protein
MSTRDKESKRQSTFDRLGASSVAARVRKQASTTRSRARRRQLIYILHIKTYSIVSNLMEKRERSRQMERFQEWGVPFPTLNVYVSGLTECAYGLLLLVGFASHILRRAGRSC